MKNAFIKLPKALLYSEEYRDLGINAVLLYALLCDRLELSKKNRWRDKDGIPFVYCTRAETEKLLHIGERAAKSAFEQLLDHGLIREVRQGSCKPNRIYPLKLMYLQNEDTDTDISWVHDTAFEGSNNTENIETEDINNENKPSVGRSVARERGLKDIFSNIDMSAVLPETARLIETVVIRMYYSESTKNGSEMLPQNEVRRLLSRLNTDHLIEAEQRLLESAQELTNPSKFLMAMLINIITSEDIETFLTASRHLRLSR